MLNALSQVALQAQSRIEARILRAVLDLPEAVSRRIFGTPERVDGQQLAPEMHAMLTVQRLARLPGSHELPLLQGRQLMTRQAGYVGSGLPIGSVRELTVQGAQEPLRARRYVPRVPTDGALLVYFHGGGMVYGDLDSHDGVCRFLAEQAAVQVISVDYRLAPEHPFPAGLEDCIAATLDVMDRVEEFGADRSRIAVGGDSAGGHFAAATALELARRDVELAFQLLVYPATDFAENARSHQLFDQNYFLTREFMDQCSSWYLSGADAKDPAASVLYIEDVPANLAPGYLCTAGFDPLRDEGEAYARLLQDGGAKIELERFEPLIHGFFNILTAGHVAPRANQKIAGVLRRALHA